MSGDERCEWRGCGRRAVLALELWPLANEWDDGLVEVFCPQHAVARVRAAVGQVQPVEEKT